MCSGATSADGSQTSFGEVHGVSFIGATAKALVHVVEGSPLKKPPYWVVVL